MSASSFKRLTVKAKQSMSGLNPFFDGMEHSSKENETSDLEDFGYSQTQTYSPCSKTHQPSPPKESPSRRANLMGSLRSIGSLRSMRSSPLKERGKDQVGHFAEPKSPRTPVREINASLPLDFHPSPPNQPIFEVLQRKCSIASSLNVQHSSPVPIPTPAKQEDTPLGVPIRQNDLPAGTVPKSPTPLQTALERDNEHCDSVSDSSPAYRQTKKPAQPMPTPMPGTNFGFSDRDLAEGMQKGEASPVELPSEPSGYFSMLVPEMVPRTEASNPNHAIEQNDGAQDASCNNPTYGFIPVLRPMPKDNPAGLQNSQVHNCNPTEARCHHYSCEKQRTHDAQVARNVYTRCRLDHRISMESALSGLNIEHIVFEEPANTVAPKCGSGGRMSVIRRAEAKHCMKSRNQRSSDSDSQTKTTLGIERASTHARWGTQGSLYDGTGYGNSSSSNSTRRSTSSMALEAPDEVVRNAVSTSTMLVQSAVAIARDHNSLEEAIRAYAALEAKCTSSFSDELPEDVVAEVQADIELANEMADHSLGA